MLNTSQLGKVTGYRLQVVVNAKENRYILGYIFAFLKLSEDKIQLIAVSVSSDLNAFGEKGITN